MDFRGSGMIEGSAKSRPRQVEHTTHLSRFRERGIDGRGGGGERERERDTYGREESKRRHAAGKARNILSLIIDIAARFSSPSRIRARNH